MLDENSSDRGFFPEETRDIVWTHVGTLTDEDFPLTGSSLAK